MRGLAAIATAAAAAALHASAGGASRASSGDVPYHCFETLLHYCHGLSGANCTACAGRNQRALQRSHCRASDISTACDTNLLRQFSLTLDNDGIDDQIRDFTYQLVTYGNQSDPGNLQPIRPGTPACFDASELDDSDSNYFILGTHAVWNSEGRVRIDQSMLQFRLTDIHDAGDAVTLHTGWWDNINASNMTACTGWAGDGCVALGPAVTTTTVTPYSTTPAGGGWQVVYNGLCGHHRGPDDEEEVEEDQDYP